MNLKNTKPICNKLQKSTVEKQCCKVMVLT
jgi:hypothetical protein